jgi:hypothetical protein
MGQKFSTPKCLIAAAAALLVLAATPVPAADVEVKSGVPERYTVQKGDTLWGIAGRFLKDPWRWPEIWRMNREQIRNPHLIYPGDVVVLDKLDGQWRLSVDRPTTRLSPAVRVLPLDSEAIPSIPPGDIEPYLSRPLITGAEGLDGSAEIVAGRDARVVRGNGDVVYVIGMDPKAGDLWHIYREGRVFRGDDGDEFLGIEQRFLGTAKVERFAQVSTARISAAREEIHVGDRLVPAPREQVINYVPHAPVRPIEGRIVAMHNDAAEAGRGWIVTINRGAADGLDVGAVLAVYRTVSPIADPRPSYEPPILDRMREQTLFLPTKRPDLAGRAQRAGVRISRVRPPVLRDRRQFDRSDSRRRLRPQSVADAERRHTRSAAPSPGGAQ